MSEPWPYPPPPEPIEAPKPTWDCPGGTCVCHPTLGPNDRVELSILLCDMNGQRMGGARCRVWARGKVINHEMPYANAHGWVTISQRVLPDTLLVEWAPADTPMGDCLPHRTRCRTTLSASSPREARTADLARLSNLGFSVGHTPEDHVQSFQETYRYTKVDGELRHIRQELRLYHDQTLLPRMSETGSVSSPKMHIREESSLASHRPVPTVAPNEPAPPPPTLGHPKAGGGALPGRILAAPTRFPQLVVSLRARFAHDAKLTKRWSDDRHLHSMRDATVELKISNPPLSLQGKSPSSGRFHNDDGVIKIIDLSPLLAARPTADVEGVITITPSKAHLLVRPGGDIWASVTPNDKNKTLSVGHLLLRIIKLDVTLRANGELSAASNNSETETTLPNGAIVTSCRAIPKNSKNTVLVDWRPDFIQCKSVKRKSAESTKPLEADESPRSLRHDELIMIHQTETKGGANLGSTLNLFTNRAAGSTSAHYVIDTDGFIVKMANEEIRCVHASGDRGSAWLDLISRNAAAKRAGLAPRATIRAFNNITVGIEHVHGRATNGFVTNFPGNQMAASLQLLRQLRTGRLKEPGGVDDIIAHNQIGLTIDNELGIKPNCPGTGYFWKQLEDAGIARKTRFNYTFKSAADQALEAYIFKNDIIDASANDLGHIRHLQEALATCGYFVARGRFHTDRYDTATKNAIRAFVLRHFSGPSRRTKRGEVLSLFGKREPIVNKLLVMTILASAEDC